MKVNLAGYSCDLDPEDIPKLAGFTFTYVQDKDSRLGYLYTNTGIPLHKLLLSVPAGMVVDHVDGDTLNNTKNNLRNVSNRFNSQNSHLRRDGKTSSIYLGVHFNKLSRQLPYRVRSYKDNKQVSLGSYSCEFEAALIYNTYQLDNFCIDHLGGLNIIGAGTTHHL